MIKLASKYVSHFIDFKIISSTIWFKQPFLIWRLYLSKLNKTKPFKTNHLYRLNSHVVERFTSMSNATEYKHRFKTANDHHFAK